MKIIPFLLVLFKTLFAVAETTDFEKEMDKYLADSKVRWSVIEKGFF